MNLTALIISSAISMASPILQGQADQNGFNFKLAVRDDGIYRVTFEELGYDGAAPASATLVLYESGAVVPIQIEDGGDGFFGSGDSISFVGRHLPGNRSWFNEYSIHNIYRLTLNDLSDDQVAVKDRTPASKPAPHEALPIVHHLEQERMRVAFPAARKPQAMEPWYWKRLSHLDSKPFKLELDQVTSPTKIRASFVGLSRDRNATSAGLSQHRVELLLNGIVIGEGEWDGQEVLIVEASGIDPGLAKAAGSTVEIRVPRRLPKGATVPLIDVVLLNWIETEYSAGSTIQGQTMPDRRNRRLLLIEKGTRSPEWIAPYRTGTLSSNGRQADYLMIVHASLMTSVQPLVEYHRSTGLNVVAVDVQDIYDEFNHGIQSPLAIRKFISHAWHQWQKPAPRFVLLVGDASWDVHGYAGRQRNLVPTMQVQAHDDFAASDNGFVTVADNDWRPDLALGRIPATNARELAGIVGKIVRYAQQSDTRTWRNRVTWVSDMSPEFQRVSNVLASGLEKAGFEAIRIYPRPGADVAAQNQAELINAFNSGQLIVHFLGHGGRYGWQTGPPDLRDNRDLFNVAHIKSLQSNTRLPLVLSMTCSSGPFDHPKADSLAETFLRLPDRGAIGVLAASWRVPASERFSATLLNELIATGISIGEAVMKAKQREPNRTLVESYNLLGDPALQLSIPQGVLH